MGYWKGVQEDNDHRRMTRNYVNNYNSGRQSWEPALSHETRRISNEEKDRIYLEIKRNEAREIAERNRQIAKKEKEISELQIEYENRYLTLFAISQEIQEYGIVFQVSDKDTGKLIGVYADEKTAKKIANERYDKKI